MPPGVTMGAVMTSLEQPSAALDEPGGFRLAQEPLDPKGVVFTAWGELDIATTPELRACLDAAFAAGMERLVVDLSFLDFLDSIAVAALLHARRQLGDEGRMSVVVAASSYARMVFEIAGLAHRLPIFATRQAAIEHVGG